MAKEIKKLEISRRAFLTGSMASIIGLGLTSCSCSGNGPSDCPLTIALSETAPDLINKRQLYTLVYCMDWHIFESLYRIDPATGEQICCLAELEPKKVDENTYEIKIYNNKYFSNGDNVTVKDVIADYEFNKSDDLYSSFFDFIKKIDIVDDYTIRISLNYLLEENLLMNKLSLLRAFKILDPNIKSADDLVGSGPYMFKDGDSKDGSEIIFEPNPYYSGDFPPDKRGMKGKLISNEKDRMQALLEGSVNIAENASPSMKETVKNRGYEEEILESSSMALLSFNCQVPPFNDNRVRQAILYAIDVDRSISNYLNGYAKHATCYLPEYHVNYHQAKNVYRYDPKKATDLLKAAKQDHFRVNIVCNQGTWENALAEQIQRDLSTIGLTTRIRYTNDAGYDIIQNGPADYHLSLVSIDPTVFGTDCDMLLNVMYGDNEITKYYTFGNQSINSRFDELQLLLKKARESFGQEQQEIGNSCLDLISEEVPAYPLLHRQIATAGNPNSISKFVPIAQDGISLIGCKGK